MKELIPWLIPLAIALVAAVLGHGLARRGAWGGLAGICLALAGLCLWQWRAVRAAPSGWDGIGAVLFVALFLLPGLVGMVLGAAVAFWRARRG